MHQEHDILRAIQSCRLCQQHLDPRPVLQFHPEAKIVIVGQAPGKKVHQTGLPFNDPSGDRLRDWLAVNKSVFYHSRTFAIIPMGFCYPGTGTHGDLPPRAACAATWRAPLLAHLTKPVLTILLGKYALDYHLKKTGSVTQTVAHWRNYAPSIIPMPHPSPRNNLWLKNNAWFERELIPYVQQRVASIITNTYSSSS